MLTNQQKRIARDLYRRSLRIERVVNGNMTVFDHDQHAEWFRAVRDEGEAAQVSSDDWSAFCSLAGLLNEGAHG